MTVDNPTDAKAMAGVITGALTYAVAEAFKRMAWLTQPTQLEDVDPTGVVKFRLASGMLVTVTVAVDRPIDTYLVDQLKRERDEARAEVERLRVFTDSQAEQVAAANRERDSLGLLLEQKQAEVETMAEEAANWRRSALYAQGEVERLREALRKAADAPCTHCTFPESHGQRNTAHDIADRATGAAGLGAA